MVSKPNGDLRIRLDPRHLNKAIKRQHHRLPAAEEIISEMAGACYFSKSDASSGYSQVKINDESADLLTFGTPFGRYCFKRLPFDIHSASEVFQAEVASITVNLTECINSQDDIIVWGTTREELDARLRSALTRIRASGLKLNRRKCIFAATPLHSSITHCLQKVCNPIHPKLKLSYKCLFPRPSTLSWPEITDIDIINILIRCEFPYQVEFGFSYAT